MILYQLDSRNYVEKNPHASDPFEDYYRFILDGDFMGGLCNKHVISIDRTGKPDTERVEQQIVKSFQEMYSAKKESQRKQLENMSPEDFHTFLRKLQKNPYNWPNRYFAWEKPDKTLLMIGVHSTQMYHLLRHEFRQSDAQAQFDQPGEYVSYLYGISPNVTYMRSGNVKFDPVEELADEVRSYKYLGGWDDPDILMDSPYGYSKKLACGRWDLAKEKILGQATRKPALDDQIHEAAGRAGTSPSGRPQEHTVER